MKHTNNRYKIQNCFLCDQWQLPFMSKLTMDRGNSHLNSNNVKIKKIKSFLEKQFKKKRHLT